MKIKYILLFFSIFFLTSNNLVAVNTVKSPVSQEELAANSKNKKASSFKQRTVEKTLKAKKKQSKKAQKAKDKNEKINGILSIVFGALGLLGLYYSSSAIVLILAIALSVIGLVLGIRYLIKSDKKVLGFIGIGIGILTALLLSGVF